MEKEPIYVTGHIHPDTDSVVSAIAYAFFKRANGINALAARLGPLNEETTWLLNHFGFEEPMLLKDARKTLAEIPLDQNLTIQEDTTILEAISIMQESKLSALAVVNRENLVIGMVTKSDLVSVGMSDTALGIDLLKQTEVKDIVKTINGSIVYEDAFTHINGKVSIIALTSAKLENYEIKDRIVIVGDDSEAQKELIQKGAGMIIAVWAKSIAAEVITTAKQYHCPIVLSGHGSMNTSRYIYFAPSVKLIMTRNPVTLNKEELGEEAWKKMMQTRFRTYPVLNEDHTLYGYVSRYHLMNYKNKKLILVDHNEFSQSVKGIEKAELLEVIDHHRICDFATSSPVSFRNEIVGSTATIIATMFRENQIPLTQPLAGLLLGAVLSDTLLFQSPTTTQKDRETANILSALSNCDIEELGKEMFSVSADHAGKSYGDLMGQDVKRFDIRATQVMIDQVMVNSLEEVRKAHEEIEKELREVTRHFNADIYILAFTSVAEKGSVFFAEGEKKAWLLECYPNRENEIYSIQKGILSRKLQILPAITKAVNQYS